MDYKVHFYIIVAVIWVIYKVYNKTKLKNAAAPIDNKNNSEQPPSSKPIESSVMNSIKDFLNEFEDNNVPQNIKTNTEKKIKTIHEDKETKKPITPHVEKISTKNKTTENDYQNIITSNTTDFDLEQAIIHSEILNRPYN